MHSDAKLFLQPLISLSPSPTEPSVPKYMPLNSAPDTTGDPKPKKQPRHQTGLFPIAKSISA